MRIWDLFYFWWENENHAMFESPTSLSKWNKSIRDFLWSIMNSNSLLSRRVCRKRPEKFSAVNRCDFMNLTSRADSVYCGMLNRCHFTLLPPSGPSERNLILLPATSVAVSKATRICVWYDYNWVMSESFGRFFQDFSASPSTHEKFQCRLCSRSHRMKSIYEVVPIEWSVTLWKFQTHSATNLKSSSSNKQLASEVDGWPRKRNELR